MLFHHLQLISVFLHPAQQDSRPEAEQLVSNTAVTEGREDKPKSTLAGVYKRVGPNVGKLESSLKCLIC